MTIVGAPGDNAPAEPTGSVETPPVENPEPAEEPAGKLDELESERDKLNQQAGADDKLAVNTDGDKDAGAQNKDSRALIKERAAELRAQREDEEKRADEERNAREEQRKQQEKVGKEQKAAAAAQRGTAEQNELVKTKSGAFGEVEGFKPKYKADADGDTYEKIKPASPWTKWMKRN